MAKSVVTPPLLCAGLWYFFEAWGADYPMLPATIGGLLLGLAALLALSPIRRWSYRLFRYSHFLMPVSLVLFALHYRCAVT